MVQPPVWLHARILRSRLPNSVNMDAHPYNIDTYLWRCIRTDVWFPGFKKRRDYLVIEWRCRLLICLFLLLRTKTFRWRADTKQIERKRSELILSSSRRRICFFWSLPKIAVRVDFCLWSYKVPDLTSDQVSRLNSCNERNLPSPGRCLWTCSSGRSVSTPTIFECQANQSSDCLLFISRYRIYDTIDQIQNFVYLRSISWIDGQHCFFVPSSHLLKWSLYSK